MKNIKKFFICSTSACTERMLDSQKVYSYLVKNNWLPANQARKADLIIISTCSFGSYEEDSSIELIKHYLKNKPSKAKLIIAGCVPKISPLKLGQIGDFVTVSPTNLCRLDEILKSEIKFDDISEPNRIVGSEVSYRPLLKKMLNGRTLLTKSPARFKINNNFLNKCGKAIKKAINYTTLLKAYINPLLVGNNGCFFYLRVSKGCLGNCSYCAKRFATGTLKSKLPERIEEEFKKGLSLGYKKFFILTEDTGCYGTEIGSTIICLLKEIIRLGEGRDYKLVVSNFNAQWFLKYYDELETLLFNNQSKIYYLQIPIQSGSNRILNLMNRNYRIEDVERCLAKLKSKIPSLNIITDIIVGFPGETEADFKMTKDFLSRIKLRYVDVFNYEDRPNTPASKMSDKIPQDIIDGRKFELLNALKSNYKSFTVVKKFIELAKAF